MDNGSIGRSQMLFAAIDDTPHCLLQGSILGVDAIDAGEGFVFLHLTIDEIIVVPVGPRAEGLLVDVCGSVPRPTFETIFLRQRRFAEAVVPVLVHAVFVVLGYPDMASYACISLQGTVWPQLVKRQNVLVGANMEAGVVDRSNPGVPIPIVCKFEF